MVTLTATVNLLQHANQAFSGFFALIDRVEDWAERRASRHTLYGMSEVALHDIGLTGADLSRGDYNASWTAIEARRPPIDRASRKIGGCCNAGAV